jgi:hypothetical protein
VRDAFVPPALCSLLVVRVEPHSHVRVMYQECSSSSRQGCVEKTGRPFSIWPVSESQCNRSWSGYGHSVCDRLPCVPGSTTPHDGVWGWGGTKRNPVAGAMTSEYVQDRSAELQRSDYASIAK